ncbi:MAG: class I tRNA ligase family protein, partial [Firmicutes bacterium]|nr:class I tRNA ligase family protein [Bacillota bacterium]
SLGNGVDPLEVIEKYGADALRIALVLGSAPGNDYRWSWERFEAGSHFANKVYNAMRFVLMNREEGFTPDPTPSAHPVDQWIWHRLNETIKAISDALDHFEFGQAARAIYDFFWDDYCDWYIEMAKVRLKSEGRQEALSTLMLVAERALKLLHPFMPFVTEELYQALGASSESIVTAEWPTPDPIRASETGASVVEHIQALIRTGRNLRAEVGLSPAQKAPFVAVADSAEVLNRWTSAEAEALLLLKAETLRMALKETGEKPEKAIAGVTLGGTVYVPLAGLVDVDRERERVQKAMADAVKERDRVEARLRDQNFVARAPEDVVAKTRDTLTELNARMQRLNEREEALR